ncbi:hypothetical protein P8452_14863 [Trifolium repens]|nr:putative glycosyltransferase [Trifolium repens]WJX25872.1 hypothetical protein P8452_14863 [Trifolium repens]
MFRTVRELDSKHNIQNLRKNIQFGSNGSGIQSMEIESQNVKPQQLKTPLSNLNSKSMTGSSKQMSKLVWPTTSTKLNSKLLQSFNYSSMKRKWSSWCDRELLSAKLEIENTNVISKFSGLYAPVYWGSFQVFKVHQQLFNLLDVRCI